MTERVSNILELVREMGNNERMELIISLLDNDLLFDDYEDMQDSLIIKARRNEPTTNYMDFLDELRKEGRPVSEFRVQALACRLGSENKLKLGL
ncbi:MAG: hypothetical protein P9X24_08235 [Candidatus Hatepunaea meridiana]|nr:hypothetical protein [Candidatus Hatepunaea meridiana]